MSTAPQPANVLVLCDPDSAQRAEVEAFVRTRGITGVAWYPLRDVDDADRRIRAGGVRVVIFPSLAELLDALWTARVAPDLWLSAGTLVELADATSAAAVAVVPLIAAKWSECQRRRRRQQVTAGLILSAAAIAAAFLLLFACR